MVGRGVLTPDVLLKLAIPLGVLQIWRRRVAYFVWIIYRVGFRIAHCSHGLNVKSKIRPA